MYYNKGNYTKVSCRTDIKKKQAMWNRFRRRYFASDNPTERRFLKTEANRVSTELKQWSKRWQNWGFGGHTWITKNFNNTYFTSSRTTGARKTSSHKSSTNKSYGKRPKNRTTHRTKTYAARRSYSAW